MKRFIAHYMLAGGDGEQVRSDTIEGLWKFIESRISAVKSSSGGRSLCVGDTKSNSADWLWRMESGGTITYSHGKYGKIAALLFGGYSPAKDLRSIPSEKRSDASRTNGKKGGRPRKTERTKMNTYTVSKEWGAEYSPSMSGHCTACGKPLNGRDTHIRHTVRAIDLNLDIKHNIEAGEIQICDRHKNLSSAVRKAFKAITGFDCGPLRNSL